MWSLRLLEARGNGFDGAEVEQQMGPAAELDLLLAWIGRGVMGGVGVESAGKPS